MAIQYKMVKRNDNINPQDEKKDGFYPRVVRKKTLNSREIAKLAAEGTSLNEVEIEAALRLLLKRMEYELLDSNHICFDEFGTFSLTAESRRVETPNEIRAESIRVKRVVFTPSPVLMKRIKDAKFVRK